MSDIAAFLHARLDEVEADHCGAKWSESKLHRSGCDTNSDSWSAYCDCDGPTFILGVSASIRAIIQLHACVHDCPGIPWSVVRLGPCPTLLHLAQVYAGHPDFDDAWRL